MTVVVTAGHVDHGKSSLVNRLTGTNPDRWKLEQRSGRTVDLGFAQLKLPSEELLSFVDVPGHIRFVRNMLSGLAAVNGCLFVVSAVEGWKQQSEEHLRILDLLGLTAGVVAVTKADIADEDLLELAKLEVEDRVANTFLANAPIVGTSSVTGFGLDALIGELDRLGLQSTAPNFQRPRLWIDRSFALAGSGTVVTGTLALGGLSVEDRLVVSRSQKPVRVRSIQNHHRSVENIAPGNRVAINLSGIGHAELKRGDALVDANSWHVTTKADASLRVLDDLSHPIERRGAYFMYVGSAERAVRLRVLGSQTRIDPGLVGNVRLHWDGEVPIQVGDRFVLREVGRNQTVGGGQFLDVDPIVVASKATPNGTVDRLVTERGWLDVEHLSRMIGRPATATVGRWRVAPATLAEAQQDLRKKIEDAGLVGLDVATLDERDRAVVDTIDDLVLTGAMATIGQPMTDLSNHWWLTEAESAGFSPPPAVDIARQERRQLIHVGLAVDCGGILFPTKTYDHALAILAQELSTNPKGVTIAQLRDMWATSRKFTLALINQMDATGATRRKGDVRIPGPRLP